MSYPPELDQWAQQLLAQLEIPTTDVNIDKILSMSGVVAHSVVRPAAPVTSFILGYVVGLAEATGQASYDVIFNSGLRVIDDAVKVWQTNNPDKGTE